MAEAFYFVLGWLLSDMVRQFSRWWVVLQERKHWRATGLDQVPGVRPGKHLMVCSSCDEPRTVHNPNLPADWMCELCLVELDQLSDEEKEDARQLAKLQKVLQTAEKPEGVP